MSNLQLPPFLPLLFPLWAAEQKQRRQRDVSLKRNCTVVWNNLENCHRERILSLRMPVSRTHTHTHTHKLGVYIIREGIFSLRTAREQAHAWTHRRWLRLEACLGGGSRVKHVCTYTSVSIPLNFRGCSCNFPRHLSSPSCSLCVPLLCKRVWCGLRNGQRTSRGQFQLVSKFESSWRDLFLRCCWV